MNDAASNSNSAFQYSTDSQEARKPMHESTTANLNNTPVIDFSVAPNHSTGRHEQLSTTMLDLDLHSAAIILKTAEESFERRDFKATAKLVEQTLPALDRLYSHDAVGKLRALRILRDSYLAMSKGIEAKDCAEVGLTVFEEIMHHNLRINLTPSLGDPSAFARPVVRKLKTLRRSKDSEFLRKRAVETAERWRTFIKTS